MTETSTMILAALGIVTAVFAVVFLLRTLRALFRGRLIRAGGSGIACITSFSVFALVALVLLSYLSYGRLTDERPVSTLLFSKLGPNEFNARLMTPGKIDQEFLLRGDEWQLDARIITWKPPMTILGLQPIYKLDRLSGRYADVDQEQRGVRTLYSLTGELPADLWAFSRRFPMLLPGVDAHYGTATYLPMEDNARFDVSISRDALIARPANEAAERAVGEWHIE